MTMTDLQDKVRPAPLAALALSTPRVVVALDSRQVSLKVLAWAADEALCRGMSLRIVTAFADPDSPNVPSTVEHAMNLQRRLRRRLEPSRPWIGDAEFVISAIDSAHRPLCPVVIVPTAPDA